MSESGKPGGGHAITRMVGILLIALFLYLLAGITMSAVVLIELPFHLVFGWMMHAARNFPSLIPQWRHLVLPACCLTVAVFMAHRFVRWWLLTKGSAAPCQLRHTIMAATIVLGASAAAIAMSGIAHQTTWLAGEPWVENHRNIEQTVAVNNARQLLLALLEYETHHNRYPDDLQQLKENCESVETLIWLTTQQSRASEPFVLLKPGMEGTALGEEPLIVSPLLPSTGRVVVGYGNGTVQAVLESTLLRQLAASQP